MSSIEKRNSVQHSDISDQDDLHNLINKNAAVSFAEYSDYSKTNMPSIDTPQASLLLSYRNMSSIEKGYSV